MLPDHTHTHTHLSLSHSRKIHDRYTKKLAYIYTLMYTCTHLWSWTHTRTRTHISQPIRCIQQSKWHIPHSDLRKLKQSLFSHTEAHLVRHYNTHTHNVCMFSWDVLKWPVEQSLLCCAGWQSGGAQTAVRAPPHLLQRAHLWLTTIGHMVPNPDLHSDWPVSHHAGQSSSDELRVWPCDWISFGRVKQVEQCILGVVGGGMRRSRFVWFDLG